MCHHWNQFTLVSVSFTTRSVYIFYEFNKIIHTSSTLSGAYITIAHKTWHLTFVMRGRLSPFFELFLCSQKKRNLLKESPMPPKYRVTTPYILSEIWWSAGEGSDAEWEWAFMAFQHHVRVTVLRITGSGFKLLARRQNETAYSTAHMLLTWLAA